MVDVRGSYVDPVTSFAANPASIISGSATTVGSTVVEANPDRKVGVWVQVTALTNGRLLVGSTSADAKILLETFGAAGSSPNATWIYGTGSVYLKGATTTVTYACMEY
jgi:hypothetical protein